MNLSVVFRQTSATVPGMMRFLRNRMVIPQTRLLRSWRVIILENHSWWMSLQVKFMI